MPQIDYYFSPISPFTYLAGTRMQEIAEKYGASITYKPMDLMVLFDRTGGTRLPDRHPSRLEYRAQDLPRLADRLGFEIHVPPAPGPVNGAPSCYAIIAAQAAGGGDLGGLAHGFGKTYWADQKDISQDEVIRAVLAEHGFDPALADSGLLMGAETYARNLEDAVAAGVFGAPFYIVTDTDQRFWGQDRLPDLDLHLSRLG